MSRSVDMMHSKLKEKYFLFNEKMTDRGLPFIITSVDRNILEQMALYCQGRMSIKDVNKYRSKAGLSALNNTKDNLIVTWTLDSKHVCNIFDAKTSNNLSRAFDIALLLKGTKAHWDLKININTNDIPDYQEAGVIGESVGLKWGGRFRDYSHFEI